MLIFSSLNFQGINKFTCLTACLTKMQEAEGMCCYRLGGCGHFQQNSVPHGLEALRESHCQWGQEESRSHSITLNKYRMEKRANGANSTTEIKQQSKFQKLVYLNKFQKLVYLNSMFGKKKKKCYALLKSNYIREDMYDGWIAARNSCYGCK